MKVFISWSGERSEALAKALREWLPLVLHYATPWLSQSDIQAGERWSIEIAKELETTNFGIICITPENMNSPWILFEAGALAKSMEDGRVIPLLLDLDFKQISGPLSQFQAKKVDSIGIKELIRGLNRFAASAISDAQLDKLFNALWADLEQQITSIPKGSTPTKHTRPQGEILEELVSSVRSVEMRVRDSMEQGPHSRSRRRSRADPEMMNMLMHKLADGPHDPIQILFIGTQYKDDVPWIYELAVEAYRTLTSGSKMEGTRALRRLSKAVDLLQHGPFSDELGLDRYSL